MKKQNNKLIVEGPSPGREEKQKTLKGDLVIVGGGMAGTCAAITAAREGMQVILVQDRPVLGGNASSEVRLWILSAVQHLRNNSRWAREGGFINEFLLENLWRNPEGNAVLVDALLLEKVIEETNIKLLLNTAMFETVKAPGDPNRIECVKAFCSQNSTFYTLKAPLFCDASGDGIMAFQAGGAFRMGAEDKEEFGELFAPDEAFGSLLGHSIYFYTKQTDHPVQFTPPSYALKEIPKRIPRRSILDNGDGCSLWWIEYGGQLDTIHDTEEIKWELWRIVYGLWDFIKNSGEVEGTENLTLEWVGMIPGKRESRRFEGDYILTQKDVVDRVYHEDAVAHGGWSIDIHPSDGFYSTRPPATHMYLKGIYSIPYRCFYSRNIDNLFLAGRIISTSHVAFGSSRIMGTCSVGGQAVGMAATYCKRMGLTPRELGKSEWFDDYRQALRLTGQYIPGLGLNDSGNLATTALLSASSELQLAELPEDGPWEKLVRPVAQLLPLERGRLPRIGVSLKSEGEQRLRVSLNRGSDDRCFSPDVEITATEISLNSGEQSVWLDFGDIELDRAGYVFLSFEANPGVYLRQTEQMLSGTCLNWKIQELDYRECGGDSFDVFAPGRRHSGQNAALRFDPPLKGFEAANVINGLQRPTPQGVNAWIADPKDRNPSLTLIWDVPREIRRIDVAFDVDYNHPLESVHAHHPERVFPFCVKQFRIRNSEGKVIAEQDYFHQAIYSVELETPIRSDKLIIEIQSTWGAAPAIFEVWVSK